MPTRAERILQKWRQNLPTEASVSDVQKVLDAYFEEVTWPKGSHIKARHKALSSVHGHGVPGILDVPTVRGRSVKKVYLKTILHAIDTIERVNNEESEVLSKPKLRNRTSGFGR